MIKAMMEQYKLIELVIILHLPFCTCVHKGIFSLNIYSYCKICSSHKAMCKCIRIPWKFKPLRKTAAFLSSMLRPVRRCQRKMRSKKGLTCIQQISLLNSALFAQNKLQHHPTLVTQMNLHSQHTEKQE